MVDSLRYDKNYRIVFLAKYPFISKKYANYQSPCGEAGYTAFTAFSDRNSTLNYISRWFDSVYTILAVISSELLAGTKNVFSTFPSYSNDR